ncbi:hypothetical protein FQA39_LY10102 [Lamprigera yunnana]|nr:hypothetical protein FQA39_LY10102 [Lamprigera yunnana]
MRSRTLFVGDGIFFLGPQEHVFSLAAEKLFTKLAAYVTGMPMVHILPLVKKHYKNDMCEEDLFEALKEHRTKDIGDKLEVLWKDIKNKYKSFALHIALLKLFGWELLGLGILKLLNELILLIISPIATAGLVSYFQNPPTTTRREAVFYTAILIGYFYVSTIIHHSTMLAVGHSCMKIRIGCTSLIYKKALRLSKSSLAQTSVGQIVNLLSNDVSKFDQKFILCHYVIMAPVQIVVATYMLYRSLNVIAFSGMLFLLLFVPLQIYIGKKISKIRLEIAMRTDERVRLLNEILNGIQVIKMYTWEKPFARLISHARRLEVNSIRTRFFLVAIMLSLEIFVTRTSIFISFIIFVLLDNKLTAEIAFGVTAVYDIIKTSLTSLFPLSIMSCAEVHISICRMQSFLLSEEQTTLKDNNSHNGLDKAKNAMENCVVTPKVNITNLSANWNKQVNDDTLSDINLHISNNELVAIVGPVGSGKSSLFNVILGELYVTKGQMHLQGKVSYASQEPWIFSSSIRQNILFGNEYEEDRYKTIIKICALEPDFRMLPHGDKTIVGDKGGSLSGGQRARVNLARCIYKKADIYLLDDPLSSVDPKVGNLIFQQCIKQFLKHKMCLLITHQLQYLREIDKIIILKEGIIVDQGTYNQLQTSGIDFSQLLQQFTSNEETTQKEKNSDWSRRNSEVYDFELDDPQQEKEKLVTGSIPLSVYINYVKAGGNWFFIFLVVIGFLASQLAVNGGQYFVAHWVTLEQRVKERDENITIDRDEIIYVYSGLTGLTILLGFGSTILFFYFVVCISINLHDTIFKKISHASMKFFYDNPVGRILNRFSNDLGTIDDYIPFVIVDFVEQSLILFGTIALSTVVNMWFILPSCALLLLFYFLRAFFLYTSRNLKRIEGIARSQIFNHLTASISGLTTIRAFSAQNTLIAEFCRHQDHHSSAWYLFISASRAFGFWTDIICNTFIFFIVSSFLFMNNDYHSGDIGLVITQFLYLKGQLSWGMRQWSELENNMISVERILEYNNVQLEPLRVSNVQIDVEWPKFGKVIFQNVSMRYSEESKDVLSNLNFIIYPGEKIGIVGRTGAGKTSTICAMFQLYEIEGSIIIDDVDTTKIPLKLLRSKLSIIPQEPVLFSGTIRKNLDPLDEYTDDLLWSALEQVELKEVVQQLGSDLDSKVSEGGSNFSVGQRQLVCLARAILRNNKILIMDEATANVDPQTDGLIQTTIRKNFSECTVLTIAHRLNTVMDSDKVLVIDAGKVIEFDHPFNLLQTTDSIFYTMVKTTGTSSFKNLYSIAENCFLNKKRT